MDMLNFTMILNMDFLSRYEEEMDLKKKKVWFSLDSREWFTMEEG